MELEESEELVEISVEEKQEKITSIRDFVIRQLKDLKIYDRIQLNEEIIGSYC
jgi:hypothetical protein